MHSYSRIFRAKPSSSTCCEQCGQHTENSKIRHINEEEFYGWICPDCYADLDLFCDFDDDLEEE